MAAWILAAPGAKRVVARSGDDRSWPLSPVGSDGLFAAIATLENFREYPYYFEVDGEKRGGGTFRVEHFPLGPDSLPHADVPKGELVAMPPWNSSIYDGTVRDWWLYVPARYSEAEEAGAAVMVFQDGEWYAKGEANACIVFDNLIHAGRIPTVIGVFVNPGVNPQDKKSTRSDEYDTCTPRYAEFIEREILAEVAKRYRLKSSPAARAICGISSGGSCAFTAAWHRPDLFGRVLSHVGSFCDFRALDKYPALDGSRPPDADDLGTWKVAHDYAPLIRKTRPMKPIRVFLQAGERDLDNQLGNWPLANRQMAAALAYAGYPHRFVMGPGFHSKVHGMAILPESLEWLWGEAD